MPWVDEGRSMEFMHSHFSNSFYAEKGIRVDM